MALIGLKGGGYVTAKKLEAVGKMGADAVGKTAAEVDELLAHVNPFADVALAPLPSDPALRQKELADQAIVASWTPEQAIKYYTYYGHNDKVYHVEDANRKIWKQQPLLPSELAKLTKLHNALKPLPTTTGTLHRYLGFHDPAGFSQFIAGFTPGSTVKMAGFTSTSGSESVSKGFAGMNYFKGAQGVMLKIHATGKQGRNLSGKSAVSSEQETLFPHGSKFRVLKAGPWTGSDQRIKHYIEIEEA